MDDLPALVRRAAGDLDAFGVLVRRFQHMAVGYAYALLGDWHLAEDAAQEAFVRAWQDLPTLRRPAGFAAWLRRIVFKYCDRRTRRTDRSVSLTDADALPAAGEDALDGLSRRQAARLVREQIDALPDEQRQVVVLFYLRAHSQREIGDFLGLPVDGVKNRLRAARARLRERMLHMLEEDLQENRSADLAARVQEIVGAAEEGDLSKLEALLKRDPDLARAKDERPGATALHLAAWCGRDAAVELLLAYGADPDLRDDQYNASALGWANENGQHKTVDLLLEKGAAINLHQATAWGRADIVRRFLALEPKAVDFGGKGVGWTPLGAAVEQGREMVELLLEHGADPNIQDVGGSTPLHRAKTVEMAALLLDRGADPNIANFSGATPLHNASGAGNLDLIRFLLKRGADPAVRDAQQRTPLHQAAYWGNRLVVEALLAAGAPVNAADSQGFTVLHHAARHHDLEMIRLLAAKGADPAARDAFGQAPLDIATPAANGFARFAGRTQKDTPAAEVVETPNAEVVEELRSLVS